MLLCTAQSLSMLIAIAAPSLSEDSKAWRELTICAPFVGARAVASLSRNDLTALSAKVAVTGRPADPNK